ncbi:MAG: peptidoglycan-binding protein [Myxococcales bacterium]|nr:peptidoglycan-binding protein [Myxococcales bacterium]MCB9709478.1 peptidoglycan-binding protein [Myxococcales bacterium]
MLKQGSKGQQVRELQDKLVKLGFEVEVDGDFGKRTDGAVRKLQALFNYSVDGLVGPGTEKLIEQQIGYGWNVQSPDAVVSAQASNPSRQA